jgi:hypothetical protein
MTTDVDIDGDGFALMAELQAIYPDLTEEQFLEIDADGDGLVNGEEMLIAVDAELIAEPTETLRRETGWDSESPRILDHTDM